MESVEIWMLSRTRQCLTANDQYTELIELKLAVRVGKLKIHPEKSFIVETGSDACFPNVQDRILRYFHLTTKGDSNPRGQNI